MKLGQAYMSEFSGEDVQPEILAEELGLREFRFPDEHYQHAEIVIQQLVGKIIPHLRGLTKEEIGDYLVAHHAELFSLMDVFPEMHRLPLLVKKNVIVSHGLLSAQLLEMSSTEFYNAFLHCMHFYLYIKSVKNLSKLYQHYSHIQGISPVIEKLVQDECNNEIQCAWGMRSSYFFNLIVPGQKGSDFVQSMLQKDAYQIPPNLRAEYKRKKVAFWRQNGLAPERILLNISHLVEDKISPDDQHKMAELDVPALNFFLCQNHILGYEEIVSKIFRNPDHTLTWVAWIDKYFDVLIKKDSQARGVFYYVFGLEGNLFENGTIPNRLKRKKEKTKKGSTGEGLPEEICQILEKKYRAYKDQIKEERKLQKPAATVAKITSPAPSQTALAALITREPTKIVVPTPDIKTIFLNLEEAKKNKTQLTQIDFSGCNFPEGTTVQVERSVPPAKKPSFEPLNNIDIRGRNIIPVVLGRDIQGHFIYRITITLPSTHRFENRNTLEVIYYAKAEPTPAEIEAEKIQQDALRNQPKSVPAPVAPVVEKVAKKVEKIIDPAEISLIAAAFVLEAHLQKYGNNDMYEGGPIEIVISDADASEVLGDEAKDLLPGHRTWIIREDNTISPSTDDADIHHHLTTIAEALRTKAQTKIEKQQEQEKQTREQAEYEQERLEFTPMLEFARGFQFEGKQNGHFEDQKKMLIEELRTLGWSLPVTWSGSQVIWRHTGPKVRIIYTSKQCISFAVNGEQSELTGAQKKCYEEIAQAFAHIARFFNVEAKERTRMVNKEKAIRKETETGAVAYDKLLQEGRARLVLFGPYQGGHGVWSSKFPTEKNPFMLDERASYGTIESLLQQYPHAELCYRRDQLCINGEIAQDASQESIENVSLNITELRQSPRARYILKKRILITLGLEKFSGDTARSPIRHEKGKKEGHISALDALNHLKDMWGKTKHGLDTTDTTLIRERIKQEGYGYKLFSNSDEKREGVNGFYEMQSISPEDARAPVFSSDIDENFLETYIDCLEFLKIRVHYVWPLSSRLDEHQARMRKHAAKIASQIEATAD